jgi:predicted transcriptional regulator
MPAYPLNAGERSRQIVVVVPESQRDRIMAIAREQDRPYSRILREAINQWLDNHAQRAA